MLEPSSKRPNVFSVLVRDPDLITSEEEITLYTRIEASEINDQGICIEQNLNELNKVLSQIHWQGNKTLIYTKKTLTKIETDQFLKRLKDIKESFGNNLNELDQIY